MTDGTEEAGFSEPDSRPPIAGLSVDAGVTRWRKRPVIVEARRVQTHNLEEMAGWCSGVAYTEETPWDYSTGAVVMPDGHYAHVGFRDWGVIVRTLEGVMLARFGWWIIKGIAGEFYPCDPEVFAGSYEAADSPATEATQWTCTHAELAAALHRTRQCRWMNDPALATMAREILAQLPEAGPDQSGEIARLKTERAEITGQLIMAKEGVFKS